jgi:hypothetical protein
VIFLPGSYSVGGDEVAVRISILRSTPLMKRFRGFYQSSHRYFTLNSETSRFISEEFAILIFTGKEASLLEASPSLHFFFRRNPGPAIKIGKFGMAPPPSLNVGQQIGCL